MEKRTKTIIIVVIVILVIIAITVGVIVLVRGSGSGPGPQPGPNPPGPHPNPGPPPNTPTLSTGQTLLQDQKLYDANNSYYLMVSSDARLSLYDSSNNRVWVCCPADFGSPPYKLTNDSTGNLVLSDVNDSVGWSTMQIFSYKPAGFPVVLFVADGIAQLVDSQKNTLWASAPVGNLNFPKTGIYGMNCTALSGTVQSLSYKRAITAQNLYFEPWSWDNCIEQQWYLSFVGMFDKNSAIYTIRSMFYTTDSSSSYYLKQILYPGYSDYVAAGIDVTDNDIPNNTYQSFILRKAPNYNNSATDDVYTISPYNYPCYNISGGSYQGQINGYDVNYSVLIQPANSSDSSQVWKIVLATQTANSVCSF